LLLEKRLNQLVVIKGDRLDSVPIHSVANKVRQVPMDLSTLRAARAVGTCFGD
jgi:hypothetical protein